MHKFSRLKLCKQTKFAVNPMQMPFDRKNALQEKRKYDILQSKEIIKHF